MRETVAALGARFGLPWLSCLEVCVQMDLLRNEVEDRPYLNGTMGKLSIPSPAL